MHVYRYRSSGLLSQKGLLYDEWYFASREELNDPIDMQSKFEFSDQSAEIWRQISLSFWDDDEQISIISTYLSDLGPISYEHLLFCFEEHKQKIFSLIFNDKSTTMSEIAAFREKLEALHSLLSLHAPGSGYTISLSKSHTDMLMWSHYANSHEGYCLVYRPIDGYLYQCPDRKKDLLDVSQGHSCSIEPKFKIEDIHYDDQLEAIDAFTLLPCQKTGYEFFPESTRLLHHSNIQRQLLTKNKCWEYEKECRLLLPQPTRFISGVSDYSSLQRLFHYDFSQVVGIIFGARMAESEKQKIRDIINAKLRKRFSNLGTYNKKNYVFDFLFQETDICSSSRAVKIRDLELNSMGSTLTPGTDYYERQLEKWKKFEGITIESGTFTYDPIP